MRPTGVGALPPLMRLRPADTVSPVGALPPLAARATATTYMAS